MIKPTFYGTPQKHEAIGWCLIGLIFIFPMMHIACIPPHLRDQYLAPKFDDNVEEVKDQNSSRNPSFILAFFEPSNFKKISLFDQSKSTCCNNSCNNSNNNK